MNMKNKNEAFTFLDQYKLGSNFVSSQFLATYSQDDTVRPHVVRMKLQKLNDLGYETLFHSIYSNDLSHNKCYFFKHLHTFNVPLPKNILFQRRRN